MGNLFTRIESREVYPVTERPHYKIKLSKGFVEFYLQGKEMKDEEIGDVIIQLINALNAAEKQIDLLFTMICNMDANIDSSESQDYLEEYPEEKNYRHKYKLEDLHDVLFHAMMNKNEKMINRYINEITVIKSKYEAK